MKLFVIEGVDGSGKSTQLKLLSEYLINKAITGTSFPRTEAPFYS
jgi:thymidylate kinase